MSVNMNVNMSVNMSALSYSTILLSLRTENGYRLTSDKMAKAIEMTSG